MKLQVKEELTNSVSTGDHRYHLLRREAHSCKDCCMSIEGLRRSGHARWSRLGSIDATRFIGNSNISTN